MDFSVLVSRRSYQSRRPGQGRRAGALERQIPKPRGTAILAVEPAGILPADQSPAEGQCRDEILRAVGRPRFRRLSDKRTYYADKRMFLSLIQCVKNFIACAFEVDCVSLKRCGCFRTPHMSRPCQKSIPEAYVRRDKQCLAQQSYASSRELSTMQRPDCV